MSERANTHSLLMGYVLWIFGFTGAHRFYYGKRKSGLLYFLTLGLLGIGWLIDVFLIPGMERQAEHRFMPGRLDYNLAWILLTFGGVLGLHRFYMGKVVTGIVWLLTGGGFLVGWAYDYWTLNQQVDQVNAWG